MKNKAQQQPELEEVLERLSDNGRWIALQQVKALLGNPDFRRPPDKERTSSEAVIIPFPGGKVWH